MDKSIKKYKTNQIDFYLPDTQSELKLFMIEAGISAGFPSPAEDYLEKKLDLNQELIKNPSSTFFGRVNGNSMIDAGIYDGDILVIDKSIEPKSNSVLVCFIDGEFTIKKARIVNQELYLMPENTDFKPIKINTENDFRLWGVVTFSIHKH